MTQFHVSASIKSRKLIKYDDMYILHMQPITFYSPQINSLFSKETTPSPGMNMNIDEKYCND